jgi:hypothetical protein
MVPKTGRDVGFAILPSFGPSPLAMPAPLAKLVAQIPNSDLRRESRRIALLADWQIYNRQKWVVETGSGSQSRQRLFLVIRWRLFTRRSPSSVIVQIVTLMN